MPAPRLAGALLVISARGSADTRVREAGKSLCLRLGNSSLTALSSKVAKPLWLPSIVFFRGFCFLFLFLLQSGVERSIRGAEEEGRSRGGGSGVGERDGGRERRRGEREISPKRGGEVRGEEVGRGEGGGKGRGEWEGGGRRGGRREGWGGKGKEVEERGKGSGGEGERLTHYQVTFRNGLLCLTQITVL